jgi:hypothetical protein
MANGYNPLGPTENSIFGEDGEALSENAIDVLEYMCRETLALDPGQWHSDDCHLLRNWVDFEGTLRGLRPPTEVTIDQRLSLDSLGEILHTALPFSEAERGWLLRTAGIRYEELPRAVEETPLWFSNKEERILAAGVRQVVKGRDLMRRWLRWRRETDEYTDQGALDVARETLCDVIRLVTPREPLPDKYRALRTLPSSEAQSS